MAGYSVVRAFREGQQTAPRRLSWKSKAMIGGAALSLLAFGTIVVRAGDDAGIYDMVKASGANARGLARSVPMPQIFVPQRPVVRTALSYAPVFDSLAPGLKSDAKPQDPKAKPALSGSPRSIKVSPAKTNTDLAKTHINSRTSYCVRSCDGFFFPLGNPDTGDLAAHDASCNRLCPGAASEVYVAPAGSRGIEDAINRRGERYEVMRTAFNHRSQFDNACSCSGNGTGLGRNYSVRTDFTLREGDLVMSREGLKVFRTQGQFPHRATAFARADLTKLSAQERKTVQAIEAASVRGSSASINISPDLRARIAAQVEQSRGLPTGVSPAVKAAMAAETRRSANGKDLRYVGPDADYDRGR